MVCAYCGRPANKAFRGYCSNVHRKLDRAPKHTRVDCAGCGVIVVRLTSQLSKSGRAFCKRCSKNTGESHWKWKSGSYLNDAGYRLILFRNSYVLEHIHNWQQANKACLLREANPHIHHINFIEYGKDFNEADNLLLLTSKEHGQVHRWFDNKHYEKAINLLQAKAKSQAYYPSQIDRFIEICQKGNKHTWQG